METQQPPKGKYNSIKNFLFKPVLKTDSKVVKYSGLGIQLSATIIVFLFGGLWLDKYFETKFIFTLVFVFLGFVGVFYKIFAVLKELEEERKLGKK
ncbi:MAG: AtpZ/AtpI family protein [Ignavibacteriae bacterium]|nr:AtpZ/AtpI family protein [Ignavibacteriota bacterium]